MMKGRINPDGTGGVKFTQPPKKTIYVLSPADINSKIFAKLSPTVGSFEGLNSLFEKLEKAMTTRLNKPMDGTPINPDDNINFKDVYFLIFNKLRSTDSPSILTDAALKLFFDATNKVHLVNTVEKNADINPQVLEMKEKDNAMENLLNSFVANAEKQGDKNE